MKPNNLHYLQNINQVTKHAGNLIVLIVSDFEQIIHFLVAHYFYFML